MTKIDDCDVQVYLLSDEDGTLESTPQGKKVTDLSPQS